jgi:hypothetical protein
VTHDAGAGNQIVQATAVLAKDEETIDEMEKHTAQADRTTWISVRQARQMVV